MKIVKDVYVWNGTGIEGRWIHSYTCDTLEFAEAHAEDLISYGYETQIDWRDADRNPKPNYARGYYHAS